MSLYKIKPFSTSDSSHQDYKYMPISQSPAASFNFDQQSLYLGAAYTSAYDLFMFGESFLTRVQGTDWNNQNDNCLKIDWEKNQNNIGQTASFTDPTLLV